MPSQSSDNEDIRKQVRTQLRYYEEVNGIDIAGAIKEIIEASVVAITVDPSPLWAPRSRAYFRERQMMVVKDLPFFMDQWMHKNATSRKINTFHFLHTISEFVDKVCPFDKPGGQLAEL